VTVFSRIDRGVGVDDNRLVLRDVSVARFTPPKPSTSALPTWALVLGGVLLAGILLVAGATFYLVNRIDERNAQVAQTAKIARGTKALLHVVAARQFESSNVQAKLEATAKKTQTLLAETQQAIDATNKAVAATNQTLDKTNQTLDATNALLDQAQAAAAKAQRSATKLQSQVDQIQRGDQQNAISQELAEIQSSLASTGARVDEALAKAQELITSLREQVGAIGPDHPRLAHLLGTRLSMIGAGLKALAKKAASQRATIKASVVRFKVQLLRHSLVKHGVVNRLEERLTELLTRLRTQASPLAKLRTRIEASLKAAGSTVNDLQPSEPQLADSVRHGLATIRLSLKTQATVLATERASIRSTLLVVERRLATLSPR
jgi:DNA repair exonuclease SbcCD ATPase subunit